MEPSDAYYKTKRSLLLFTGCLLLAVFAGFKLTHGEQRISVLPFELNKPEFLRTIFCLLVLFFLFQLGLQWAAQNAEVQTNRFHRFDFLSTFAIGVISVLIFVWDTVPFANLIGKLETAINPVLLSALVTALGAVVVGVSSSAARRSAEFIGRRLKITVRDEERALNEMLRSQVWTLNFNPENPQGQKMITFEEDGEIGAGRNNNENKWRIRNGLLEILNSNNQIFSRFKYNSGKRSFEHTNDPDTLSIRSQMIVPRN
jgi:hypothetical protein